MTETYLTLIDRLNRQKAEVRIWQIKELQAADDIQTFIQLQNELKDQIESLEAVIRQWRYSEQPKTWFQRAFSR